MNAKVALSVAALAAVCGLSQGIFTGTGGTATLGSVALVSGGSLTTAGALALGGLALLKVGAIAAIALSRGGKRRGKREAFDNEDSVFAIAAQLEPAACYRRLICELASGKLPKSENDVILNLFQQDAAVQDVKFEFATAAKVGKLVKDIEACEIRYSCPVSGKDMNDALLN